MKKTADPFRSFSSVVQPCMWVRCTRHILCKMPQPERRGMLSCRIFVSTPIECVGLVDTGDVQYRVHTWLDRTLRGYENRVAKIDEADVVFFNASFSFRHSLRYRCFAALDRFASTTNKTIYAVSFGETTFFPRYNKPLPKHVRWLIMDSKRPVDIVVPFSAQLAGWRTRKAFFFSGHIPKPRISALRLAIHTRLSRRTDAFVSGMNVSNRAPRRLSSSEYIRAAMTHRFCIAASGDNFATPKMTEAVLFAAHGGCLPIIVSSNRHMRWPFELRFDLKAHGIFATLSTFDQTIEWASRMNKSEALAIQSFYKSIASSYQSVVRATSASRTTLDEMCRGENRVSTSR